MYVTYTYISHAICVYKMLFICIIHNVYHMLHKNISQVICVTITIPIGTYRYIYIYRYLIYQCNVDIAECLYVNTNVYICSNVSSVHVCILMLIIYTIVYIVS